MTVQRILDPADVQCHGQWHPHGPLPRSVRTFGRFPSVDRWRPGDLLLFSAANPTVISRRVIEAQLRGGYAEEDARWHHAAVYVGDARICEALARGVTADFVYKYVGTHRIRVRRDPLLTPEEGYDVAVRALVRSHWTYSFATLLRLLRHSWRGFHAEPPVLPFASSRAVICSVLYADAYSAVTKRVLGNAAGAVPVPAFLSGTPSLEDVESHWLSIT